MRRREFRPSKSHKVASSSSSSSSLSSSSLSSSSLSSSSLSSSSLLSSSLSSSSSSSLFSKILRNPKCVETMFSLIPHGFLDTFASINISWMEPFSKFTSLNLTEDSDFEVFLHFLKQFPMKHLTKLSLIPSLTSKEQNLDLSKCPSLRELVVKSCRDGSKISFSRSNQVKHLSFGFNTMKLQPLLNSLIRLERLDIQLVDPQIVRHLNVPQTLHILSLTIGSNMDLVLPDLKNTAVLHLSTNSVVTVHFDKPRTLKGITMRGRNISCVIPQTILSKLQFLVTNSTQLAQMKQIDLTQLISLYVYADTDLVSWPKLSSTCKVGVQLNKSNITIQQCPSTFLLVSGFDKSTSHIMVDACNTEVLYAQSTCYEVYVQLVQLPNLKSIQVSYNQQQIKQQQLPPAVRFISNNSQLYSLLEDTSKKQDPQYVLIEHINHLLSAINETLTQVKKHFPLTSQQCQEYIEMDIAKIFTTSAQVLYRSFGESRETLKNTRAKAQRLIAECKPFPNENLLEKLETELWSCQDAFSDSKLKKAASTLNSWLKPLRVEIQRFKQHVEHLRQVRMELADGNVNYEKLLESHEMVRSIQLDFQLWIGEKQKDEKKQSLTNNSKTKYYTLPEMNEYLRSYVQIYLPANFEEYFKKVLELDKRYRELVYSL